VEAGLGLILGQDRWGFKEWDSRCREGRGCIKKRAGRELGFEAGVRARHGVFELSTG
jgi:hypothetical protein